MTDIGLIVKLRSLGLSCIAISAAAAMPIVSQAAQAELHMDGTFRNESITLQIVGDWTSGLYAAGVGIGGHQCGDVLTGQSHALDHSHLMIVGSEKKNPVGQCVLAVTYDAEFLTASITKGTGRESMHHSTCKFTGVLTRVTPK